jgi:Zn-dependent peptidase ImmA (M78 family)
MLPKKIKVAGVNYKIEEKELSPLSEIDKENGEFQMGWCIKPTTTIQINSVMSKDKIKQTFVHELVHALMQESGLDSNLENEEDITNRLGLVLYQTLKDNDFSFIRK